MRTLLVAVVVAAGLAVAAPRANQVDDANHIPSIAPLFQEERIVCSAWSLNQQDGYWATAAHCVQGLDPEQADSLRVATEEATVFTQYAEDDIAVLHTDHGAPALTLAAEGVQVGDEVHLLGYPLLSHDTLYARGYVMAPSFHSPLWNEEPPVAWFALTTCKGHSGSPIGNARYEVISINQQSMSPGLCGPISIGVTWETLVRDLAPFQR